MGFLSNRLGSLVDCSEKAKTGDVNLPAGDGVVATAAGTLDALAGVVRRHTERGAALAGQRCIVV